MTDLEFAEFRVAAQQRNYEMRARAQMGPLQYPHGILTVAREDVRLGGWGATE